MGLPSNFIKTVKIYGDILKKTAAKKKLTKAEAGIIAEFEEELEREKSRTYVSNQIELGTAIGVVRETISKRMKVEGCPGRSAKGYCVEDWKAWMLRFEEEESRDYSNISVDATVDTAEIHRMLLAEVAQLDARKREAEKLNDRPAEKYYRDELLKTAKAAKDYENLVQKFKLETGEMIEWSEVRDTLIILRLALMEGGNRAVDELAIRAAVVEKAREFRGVCSDVVEKEISKAVLDSHKSGKVEKRVMEIFTTWE